MAEGPTPPPATAGRAARRAAARKRRLPLALLVVPVVLVGLGVALFLILAGDGGGILGGDDDADEVPEFAFKLSGADAVATAEEPDLEALDVEAEAVAQDVVPVLDELYTNAFLDPANWREGDYEEVFALFSNGAAASAQENVETLTLGTAGQDYERVTPRKGGLRFTVLFDPAGAPNTVVARVRFYALGERRDGTFISIVSAGQLFLRDLDGWKVTAFDIRRNDSETEPPTPAPSGTSPAATGATG